MSKYTVKDLRGRFSDPDGSWGTGTKGAGVIQHYNGPDVPAWAWRDPIKFIRLLFDLHSQPGRFAAGWTFDGIAYCEVILGYTVYRTMNWRAWTPHCGNLYFNKNALGLYIPVGGNQRPQHAAKGTMMTAMNRSDDHLQAMGLGRNGYKGHREVGSSRCPGPIIMPNVRAYRDGLQLDKGGGKTAPKQPGKTKTVYRVQIGWFENYGNADEFENEVRAKKIKCFKEEKDGGWAIYSGVYSTEAGAEKRMRFLGRQGIDSYTPGVGDGGKA